jgi:Family of unknown function (DUF5681)
METPTRAGRQQDGTFAPGVSGNPKGRTKGQRNRATRIAEALLEGECRALVRKAVELALAGDVTAIKLCLERILPRRHERTLALALPPVTEPGAASAAIAAIIRGVGTGDLTPGEAKALVALVEAALKSHELVDHEKRLTAVEERK